MVYELMCVPYHDRGTLFEDRKTDAQTTPTKELDLHTRVSTYEAGATDRRMRPAGPTSLEGLGHRDLSKAPVTKMLKDVPGMDLDPLYIVFADSSHTNSNEGRLTACGLHVLLGGLTDHMSMGAK